MSRFSMGLSGTALAVALGASVGCAAGIQFNLRWLDAQLSKEHVLQVVGIMLAGPDETNVKLRIGAD